MPVKHKHSSETVIEFSGVTFTYAGEPAVEDISFTVESGDYVGLIGPNGGGKTTVLRLLLGLLSPQYGRVKIFGEDVGESVFERAHIGYVPQRVAQSDDKFPITVQEAVSTGRTARIGLFKWPTRKDRHAVGRALELTGLSDFRERRIGALSGGQRQRVYIARALASEPNVLVLDEPTAGVDQESQDQFYAFLRKLHKDLGLTVVLVSHDIGVVAKGVTNVVCINRRLVCSGRAHDVLTSSHFKDLYGGGLKRAFHGH